VEARLISAVTYSFQVQTRDPDIPLSRQFPPFTWCRTFPPSTTTICQSTISSDLPLTCTKLIAVDLLGSEVPVDASFQISALTAGGNVIGGEGKRPGGICPRENVLHSQAVRNANSNVNRGACGKEAAAEVTTVITGAFCWRPDDRLTTDQRRAEMTVLVDTDSLRRGCLSPTTLHSHRGSLPGHVAAGIFQHLLCIRCQSPLLLHTLDVLPPNYDNNTHFRQLVNCIALVHTVSDEV